MKQVVMDVAPPTPFSGVSRTRQADAPSEAKRLAADIERAIRVRTGRTIHDLQVTVTKDCILLTGNCSTYYTKQLAQHAAMTLLVNEKLTNDIEVV
jgi:osmotically-inducible protein OsmY